MNKETTWFMGVEHNEDCKELLKLRENDTEAIKRHGKMLLSGVVKHKCE